MHTHPLSHRTLFALGVLALLLGLLPALPATAATSLPSGGSCANPPQITSAGVARGSTVGASDEHNGVEAGGHVNGDGAPDHVWAFTLAEAAELHVKSVSVDPFVHMLAVAYQPTHPDNDGYGCGDKWANVMFEQSSNWSRTTSDWGIDHMSRLGAGAYYLWLDGDNDEAKKAGAYELHIDFVGGQPVAGGGSATPPASGTDRRMADSSDVVAAAVDLSRGTFADGTASYAVIGRNDVFADSLAAAALAGKGGPILYTTGGAGQTLRPETLAEISRVLGPPSSGCDAGARRVFLLGGPAAVSSEVEQAVKARGYCAQRFAGASRVETAVLIADYVASTMPVSRVLLARADNWADAATGGAYAAAAGIPILVTQSASLHPAVAAFLDARRPSITLLGGEAALSSGVASGASRYGSVTRVSGPARDATAAAIATQLWAPLQPDGVMLVNGYTDLGWAYALAAAVTSAREGAVQLYVQAGSLTPGTESYLSSTSYVFTIAAAPVSLVSEQVYQTVVQGSSGSSPSPQPTDPACVESGIAYNDEDDFYDNHWNKANYVDISSVEVDVTDTSFGCQVTITQRWYGGSVHHRLTGFVLDVDGDASTGCTGGEVVVLANANNWGSYDSPTCDGTQWTEASVLVSVEVYDGGVQLRFLADEFPKTLRFTTWLEDAEGTVDWAPDDSSLGPNLTPVF